MSDKPRPPAELVDALQDRIHPTSGRLLRSVSVRFYRHDSPPRMDGRGIVYGVLFGIGCWLALAAIIWGAAHLLREVL